MSYDRESTEPQGPGRWEPADDGEHRRWHGDDGRRGGRRRGRAHFGGPFGGPPFPGGPGFPGRPGFGGPEMHVAPWLKESHRIRGPRARRGDVRAAALALLSEHPKNGYQIIQEITDRSGGVWRPSPGSVYPALQQLEDEGLIRAEAGEGGRRAYQLTDEGQQYAASHADELRAPWDVVAGSAAGKAIEMRQLVRQVAMAAIQVVGAGTDAQVAQARQLLTDTRKGLYRILASDEAAEGGDANQS